jgi:uncharacterized RDD family membrane protein YckC
MKEETEVIDDLFGPIPSKYKSIANIWDRVRHFAIDTIIILPIHLTIYFAILKPVFTGTNATVFIFCFFTTSFIYYFLSELLFKRTIGYFMNKSAILNDQMERPSLKQTFIRSIFRLLYVFSIGLVLTPNLRSVHDIISKTWVLQKK